MKKLLPDSRKLRVLLIAVLGFLANTYGDWLAPEQIELLAGLIMVWLGGQSIADAGLQGKILGEARRQKKEEAALSAFEAQRGKMVAGDFTSAEAKSSEEPADPAAQPEIEDDTNADASSASAKRRKRGDSGW